MKSKRNLFKKESNWMLRNIRDNKNKEKDKGKKMN